MLSRLLHPVRSDGWLCDSSDAEAVRNPSLTAWHAVSLSIILIAAAVLRLYVITDWHHGSLLLTGTCNQPLVDEIQPLVASKNLLKFEAFFYPPVAPLVITMVATPMMAVFSENLDLGVFCRCLSIGISVATLVVLYFIGKEWGRRVGFIAVVLFAVTMIAVVSTENVQVYSTFFVMLALYCFFRSLRHPSRWSLALMGVFLGLGVATKYFPIVLSLMLFLVYFAVREKAEILPYNGAFAIVSAASRRGFPNILWNGVLYSFFFVCLTILYLGLFHDTAVMDAIRTIYDGSAHDNPFEYHLHSIVRIYHLGLLGVGSVAVLTGLGILVPRLQHMSSWEWIARYYHRHWLWILPSAGMGVTLLVTLGIPVALNPNNYFRYTAWAAQAYASGDNGMFPAGRPAPSYFLSFFPENLGIPLFIIGCLGMVHCLWSRDRKALFLFFIMLPMYLMLERSSVKVNRYALELMPVFCLFGAIAIDRVSLIKPATLWRTVSLTICAAIIGYSAFYSLAWANFYSPVRDVRVETVEWLKANVHSGSYIGMNAKLILEGSPELIPDPGLLGEFRITHYTDYPEYVVLPKLAHAIMSQYIALTDGGYQYHQNDWLPQYPPPSRELTALADVIHQKQYMLVKEFEKTPEIWGLSFGPQRFGGPTWFREHAGAYGIQIYQKRSTIQSN